MISMSRPGAGGGVIKLPPVTVRPEELRVALRALGLTEELDGVRPGGKAGRERVRALPRGGDEGRLRAGHRRPPCR